jgi:hypothetical protein
MSQPKNKALEMAKRRARVAELYLQGRYQWEIACALDVTQATVSRDIAALHQQWETSGIFNFDAAQRKELARIDALEREYWIAYHASKEDKESTATEKTDTPDGARLKAAVRKERRDGNPAFLAGVQWCITQRCKILGFEAAKKLDVRGKEGGPIEFIEVSGASDDTDRERDPA